MQSKRWNSFENVDVEDFFQRKSNKLDQMAHPQTEEIRTMIITIKLKIRKSFSMKSDEIDQRQTW